MLRACLQTTGEKYIIMKIPPISQPVHVADVNVSKPVIAGTTAGGSAYGRKFRRGTDCREPRRGTSEA